MKILFEEAIKEDCYLKSVSGGGGEGGGAGTPTHFPPRLQQFFNINFHNGVRVVSSWP